MRSMTTSDNLRPTHADRPYEELVAEAVAAPTEGWDFSWFDGRATEERPSWGYARLMGSGSPVRNPPSICTPVGERC